MSSFNTFVIFLQRLLLSNFKVEEIKIDSNYDYLYLHNRFFVWLELQYGSLKFNFTCIRD